LDGKYRLRRAILSKEDRTPRKLQAFETAKPLRRGVVAANSGASCKVGIEWKTRAPVMGYSRRGIDWEEMEENAPIYRLNRRWSI